MLSVELLIKALASFPPPPHAQQQDFVHAQAPAALLIVAGPGTGRTANFRLPILKFVLVDGAPGNPSNQLPYQGGGGATFSGSRLGSQGIDFMNPVGSINQQTPVNAIDILVSRRAGHVFEHGRRANEGVAR